MGAARFLAGNHCTVHHRHYPEPARTVGHHRRPLEYGGTNTPDNIVLICDTGHYNLHAYIDTALWNYLHPDTIRALPKLTRSEKPIAAEGYDQAKIHADTKGAGYRIDAIAGTPL